MQRIQPLLGLINYFRILVKDNAVYNHWAIFCVKVLILSFAISSGGKFEIGYTDCYVFTTKLSKAELPASVAHSGYYYFSKILLLMSNIVRRPVEASL